MLWADFSLFQKFRYQPLSISSELVHLLLAYAYTNRLSNWRVKVSFLIILWWNFDDTLMSVGSLPLFNCRATWSENQSLYRFWKKAFTALLTVKYNDWNLSVSLWGTISISHLLLEQKSCRMPLSCPLKVSIIANKCCPSPRLPAVNMEIWFHQNTW